MVGGRGEVNARQEPTPLQCDGFSQEKQTSQPASQDFLLPCLTLTLLAGERWGESFPGDVILLPSVPYPRSYLLQVHSLPSHDPTQLRCQAKAFAPVFCEHGDNSAHTSH